MKVDVQSVINKVVTTVLIGTTLQWGNFDLDYKGGCDHGRDLRYEILG